MQVLPGGNPIPGSRQGWGGELEVELMGVVVPL